MSEILQKSDVERFFRAASLISRQIMMDSMEKDRTGFEIKSVDVDGDFGYKENTVDSDKLERVLSWLREQLELQADDLKIIRHSNGSLNISSNDRSTLMEFFKSHIENSNNIDIVGKLDKTHFYTKDTYDASNLSHKGLAVMQDYYSKKDNMRNDTFIGNDDDLNAVFNKLAKAKNNTSINILYRSGGSHWIPLKCEKKNDHYYFMEMDSLGKKGDFSTRATDLALIREISQSTLPKNKVTVYRANNTRQTAPNNCGIFSLKDARKMQNNAHLQQSIEAHTTTSKTLQGGLVYKEYITPKEHMKTTQSRSAIQAYVKQYNKLHEDGKLPTAVTPDELFSQSFFKKRSREKSAVQTGEGTRNLTAVYFKDKYMAQVVDAKIKASSEKELQAIVEQYNLKRIDVPRLNVTADNPRDTSRFTPDKEEIVLVEQTVENVPSKENTDVISSQRSSVDHSSPKESTVKKSSNTPVEKSTHRIPPQTYTARNSQMFARTTEHTHEKKPAQHANETRDFQNHWDKFKFQFKEIKLMDNPGFLTSNAYKTVLNYVNTNDALKNDGQELQRERLAKLKDVVAKINIGNIKDPALKSVLQDVKEYKLPPEQQKKLFIPKRGR